jgi:DNA helicase-2/ATP-dependent DNA helicase PcrA
LELFDLIIEDTKYIESFGEDEEGRIDNINELRNSIYEMEEETEEHMTLGEYLETTSLMSATDSLEEEKDYVKLMTIHNSKGLEFPIVFLTGMEQEIFPGFSKEEDEEALEEERRLCYVAITRAEKELHLTQSLERVVYGQKSYMRPPSRFIEEIPMELIEMEGTKLEVKKEKIKTSGIENFNPFKINKKIEGAYLPGDKVIHKKFGQGLIKDVEEGKRIVIRFREGEKKIPLAVAEKFLSKVD